MDSPQVHPYSWAMYKFNFALLLVHPVIVNSVRLNIELNGLLKGYRAGRLVLYNWYNLIASWYLRSWYLTGT